MNNNKEFFPNIKKIQFNPNAKTTETMVFRHYNPDEVVLGRSMKEWLRFAVCYWHTFVWEGNDAFGNGTLTRQWNANESAMEKAKDKARAAFEFFSKLGVPYYCFHDRDVAPEGTTLEESNKNLDTIVDLFEQLQKETGVKLLWGTANQFSHPRYMNGASTNPDVHAFAYAASQVKKMIEVTHRLGGENFVFWGGREGYQTLLNTNVKEEIDHMASFLKMAVRFKEEIGFKGQFLLEPKPKEPTKHQYDYDAQTVYGFLKTYGLDGHFKVNIEPNHTTLAGHSYEHDLWMASQFGYLGSLDINTGSPDLGWDTDQFLMDPKLATIVMLTVIKQNGLQPGGLNFDCKLRRESSDLEDLFIAHIGAMDNLAFALKKAALIYEDKHLEKNRIV
jgi:xylose isomerase